MIRKHFCVGLFVLVGTLAWGETVGLEHLDTSDLTCGWRTPQVNRSILGNALTIGGRKFAKGLGVHAPSKGQFELDGTAMLFEATVGVDDEEHGGGSVEFKVWGDGKLLWESGLMRGNRAPRTKDLKVDVPTKIVTVTFDPARTDTTSLRKAFNKIGYQAKVVKFE